jgi:hypothetical protein
VLASTAGAVPFIPDYNVTSTVPLNGDGNPYGVAFVPSGFPAGEKVKAGDILVSNFNDKSGKQGKGTTIIQFEPGGPIAETDTYRILYGAGDQYGPRHRAQSPERRLCPGLQLAVD